MDSHIAKRHLLRLDGNYVWVMCYGTDYLVNLSNFRTKSYPGYSQDDIDWSADSKFVWIDNFDPGADSGIEILSVSNGELKSLAVSPVFDTQPWWHPTDNVLAYIADSKQKLELVNAQTMLVQELELPITFNNLSSLESKRRIHCPYSRRWKLVAS